MLLGLGLQGCATIEGAGKDIESAGEWIQRKTGDSANQTDREQPNQQSLASNSRESPTQSPTDPNVE